MLTITRGNVWQSSGCAAKTGVSSCVNYVANNPSAFANAYWDVAVVKVYQRDSQSTVSHGHRQVSHR